MRRSLGEVNQIMDAKQKVANDRDLLQNMLRYLKERIKRLEGVYKKKHHKSLRKQLRNYRTLAGSILHSIAAANAMLQSTSDNKILKVFKTIYQFLVDKICTIKKASTVFTFKFIGIYTQFDEMVANATELKKLVRA